MNPNSFQRLIAFRAIKGAPVGSFLICPVLRTMSKKDEKTWIFKSGVTGKVAEIGQDSEMFEKSITGMLDANYPWALM